MTDVLTHYFELRSKSNLPEMKKGGFQREALDDFDTSQNALDSLKKLSINSGWLLFQSWQGAFVGGLPDIDEANWGSLLAGELELTSGDCSIIEHRPGTGWRVIQLRHNDQADGFWDEVTHVARQPTGHSLVYRRYWKLEEEKGALQIGTLLKTVNTIQGGA